MENYNVALIPLQSYDVSANVASFAAIIFIMSRTIHSKLQKRKRVRRLTDCPAEIAEIAERLCQGVILSLSM